MISRRFGLFIIVTLSIGLVLLVGGFFQPIADIGRMVFLPATRVFSKAAIGVSDWWPPAVRQRVEELKQLETRILRLTTDYVRLRALEEENQNLRAQAHFLAASGYDSIGARIIGRELDSRRALLLIDRGAKDQLEKGLAVAVGDGVYVGRLRSVNEYTATVELMTDPASRVASTVLGEHKKIIGVVEGRGNGAARLTYVPSSESIKPDQLIVTAGTDDKIPPDLVLGIINAVSGKSTDPFLSAVMEPIIPADKLLLVSVLRPTALRPRL